MGTVPSSSPATSSREWHERGCGKGSAADVCMYRRSKKVGIAAAASQRRRRRRRRKRRSRTQNAKRKTQTRKKNESESESSAAAQQRNPSSLIKKRHELYKRVY